MASKLFHTVVGFGISLGAMSMGCSAPAEEPAVSAEAQVIATDPYGEPTPVTKDPFCEVAWPTTKGGPRPEHAQACIDPDHECGAYPDTFWFDLCVPVIDAATKECDGKGADYWMFCKEGTKSSHEWTCPSGTMLVSQCDWRDEDAPRQPERKQ